VRRADRGTQVGHALEHVAGEQVRPRPQTVDAPLPELGVQRLERIFRGLERLRRGIGERQHSAQLAEPQSQLVAGARRAGRGALDHMLDRRGCKRARALPHRAGVRPQLGRDREDGRHVRADRTDRDSDRRAVAGPRLRELDEAAPELRVEQVAQARGGVARRVRSARVGQGPLELARRVGHPGSLCGVATGTFAT
jgi:hypothetical protein